MRSEMRNEKKNLCVASARLVARSKNKRSLLRDAGSRRKQNAEKREHVVSARSIACDKNIQMSGSAQDELPTQERKAKRSVRRFVALRGVCGPVSA
jgi:hypothetical protein